MKAYRPRLKKDRIAEPNVEQWVAVNGLWKRYLREVFRRGKIRIYKLFGLVGGIMKYVAALV